MCEEIKLVKEMGLSGVVVGCGDESGLAYDHLQELCNAAKGMDITLHQRGGTIPHRMLFDCLLTRQLSTDNAGAFSEKDNAVQRAIEKHRRPDFLAL